MQHKLDLDWKAKLARHYFAMTWDGPLGTGVLDGCDSIETVQRLIDEIFHENYKFIYPNGELVRQGIKEFKAIMHNLITPLKNLKMTSFDVISLDEGKVTFQSTAVADKKVNDERYVQCLRLTYEFEGKKVSKAIVHYHSNYEK